MKTPRLTPFEVEDLLVGKLRHLLKYHFSKQSADPSDEQHYIPASNHLRQHKRSQIREAIQLVKYERSRERDRYRAITALRSALATEYDGQIAHIKKALGALLR